VSETATVHLIRGIQMNSILLAILLQPNLHIRQIIETFWLSLPTHPMATANESKRQVANY